MKWRRGFDTPPPPVSSFSHAYPGNDDRYVNYVEDVPISWFETLIRSFSHGQLEIHRQFPKSESLKDCKCYTSLKILSRCRYVERGPYQFVCLFRSGVYSKFDPYFVDVLCLFFWGRYGSHAAVLPRCDRTELDHH
jgi:hypothetical protein